MAPLLHTAAIMINIIHASLQYGKICTLSREKRTQTETKCQIFITTQKGHFNGHFHIYLGQTVGICSIFFSLDALTDVQRFLYFSKPSNSLLALRTVFCKFDFLILYRRSVSQYQCNQLPSVSSGMLNTAITFRYLITHYSAH